MNILLGKCKLFGRSKNSLSVCIPLIVQENLHIQVNQELFTYLENGKIFLETVKRDESTYGIYKDVCFLGMFTARDAGNVLQVSFSTALKEQLGVSVGDYLGYYFEDGKIYFKKYS